MHTVSLPFHGTPKGSAGDIIQQKGSEFMDYEALLHEILNIGEAMLKSGAEVDRAEDSMYRMCKSYDLISCEVFAIQSNIQATIQPKGGHYLTQIRRVRGTSFNYDRLDYLNNLSRQICRNAPGPKEMHEMYLEVMNRKPQPKLLSHLAAIMGGAGFGVYFGCDFQDALVATLICSLIIVCAGDWLSRRENNLVVYNMVLSFLSAVSILLIAKLGLGNHPDRIILGVSMVLISGLGTTNGIRDVLNHDIIAGILNIANSFLGAIAIACGIGLAMIVLKGAMYEMYIAPDMAVQLISCGLASMGFALFFKAAPRQSACAGIGGLINCACHTLVYQATANNFTATLTGAVFVAGYAYVMSRIHRAPSTIFLTTSVMPIIPGATLFYMMHGFVQADYTFALQQTLKLFQTCLAIAFGFIIIEIITRYISFFANALHHRQE